MGRGANAERPPVNAEHPSTVIVYLAAGGWQSAVEWWNPEGFEECWETGLGPYAYESVARAEAAAWAEAWELALVVSAGSPDPKPAANVSQTFRELFPDAEIVELDPEREP